ncbi:GMC oxidoreductase [Amycolatopsis pigmentata]|uniref:GMC oxidoreductase n=1 Tax=Amycolatopsis pigmentata TaxID=450801 RepID=A0ABW5G5P1_9PSEU
MTEQVDVLIIGSGPSGSTYARTIGDAVPTARILMVEAGPVIPGIRGDHTQNMTDEERAAAQLLTQGPDEGLERAQALSDIAEGLDPSLEFRHTILPGLFFLDPRPALEDGEVGLPAASMASGVGGMGIHWGISCPRPSQSERTPFIPTAELDAALDHAEQLLGVRKWDVPGTGLAEAIRAAQAEEFDGPGLTPVGFMPAAYRWEDGRLRFSGTGMILGDIEETVPGFELRAQTLAKRVIVEDGVAVGAALEDRVSGETYEVRAHHVVVCADGLRTPQVLFASGVRPPALAHYLNEHFQVSAFGALTDDFAPERFDNDPEHVGYVIVPFSDERPMQGGILPLMNSPYRLAVAGQEGAERLTVFAWYGAKDIQYCDRIEFSETETDFYGMPKMTIHYSRTEKDLQTIEQLKQNARRSADRVGGLAAEPELAAGGSSLHYHGTVRMGAVDDGTSVCDQHLKVWGVDNLYVGGNGVIPTATATNPTLTIVALAWRAANQIALQLNERVGTAATAAR